MIYAQIKNGVIRNMIVLDDTQLQDLFLEGFDYLIRVDNLEQIPHIGDLYENNVFTPAPEEPV